MKRECALSVLLFFILSFCLAQDGSDIMYFDPTYLDEYDIGKECHIDFGNISFAGEVVDTIEINIKGKQTMFYEHRIDNGFNNWFKDQYLLNTDNKLKIRLHHTIIDSLTQDKIYVSSTLSYYIDESPLDTITLIKHSYNRNNVARVLFRNGNRF